MNCAQSQRSISAQRDAPLAASQRAELEVHLAACSSCAAMRSELERAAAYWRASTAQVPVPNASREWQILRRALHAPKTRSVPVWLRPRALIGIGIPAAAMAALAVAFVNRSHFFRHAPQPVATTAAISPDFARAEFVDVPGNSASTMVYVDNSSGWLVVWADPGTKS